MPFYAQDWREDEAVGLLALDERGLYVECLLHQWIEGSLPDDAKAIARLVRARPAAVRRCWPAVRAHFRVRTDGRLVNDRLEEIRGEQLGREAKRSAAAAKAATKRWDRSRALRSQSDGNADAMRPQCPTEPNTEPEPKEKEEGAPPPSAAGAAPPPANMSTFAQHYPESARAWAETGLDAAQRQADPRADVHIAPTLAPLGRDFGDAALAAAIRAYDRWRRAKPGKVRGRKRHDDGVRRWIERDADGERNGTPRGFDVAADPERARVLALLAKAGRK
jgi:uncharacterized protein YdaU (DUF1376 family)